MKRSGRILSSLAASLALVLAVTACGGGSKAEPPKEGARAEAPKAAEPTATFRYLTTAKPTTFDPAMVSDVPTMQILQNVYSGLVTNDENGNVVADLAASWKVSEDGKTYTFTLKDAKFHDGSKVTAEDFKRSMVRAMNPKLKSPVSDSYLDNITGYARFLGRQKEITRALDEKKIDAAEADRQLAAAYEELKKNPGIEAKDEKTLVITIVEPAAYFLAKLTYPTAFAVHKSMPEDRPLDPSPANVKLMIGTGPFKAESYAEGSKFVLKRFADFAGYGDKARVGTVEIAIIETEAAALAAYRSGQLDVAGIPVADYKAIKADPNLSKEMLEFPTARVNYFALNQDKWAPARDVRVRQAFNLGIDREKLNEVVFQGTQFPAYGVLPPGIPGALKEKVQGYKFDPAKGRELLKQAGYGEGGKELALKITYRAKNETSQRLAEFLQNQLTANLGVKVELEPMEWGKLLEATRNKTELDSFTLGWSADYIDPQDFLTILLHTNAPYNRYGYSNKELDAILDKADRMAPGEARIAEYSKAEQIAVTDAAWVPTTFAKSLWLVKPYVKGFRYNAMGIMPLNQVTVSK